MKVVIIGGVAVGATAATRIRRLDESAQIVLFERTGYVSYANCGLPYYVGGVIDDPDALTLQTPEALFKRFRIDARTRCEVVAINRAEKTVDVINLTTGERFVESFIPASEKGRLAENEKAARRAAHRQLSIL